MTDVFRCGRHTARHGKPVASDGAIVIQAFRHLFETGAVTPGRTRFSPVLSHRRPERKRFPASPHLHAAATQNLPCFPQNSTLFFASRGGDQQASEAAIKNLPKSSRSREAFWARSAAPACVTISREKWCRASAANNVARAMRRIITPSPAAPCPTGCERSPTSAAHRLARCCAPTHDAPRR